MPNYNDIAEALSQPIPDPYIQPPKDQGSWATLHPGDYLRSPPGGLYRVERTTNDGALLCHTGVDVRSWLKDRDWKDQGWSKVSKREVDTALGL
jgi:hypothetical protein